MAGSDKRQRDAQIKFRCTSDEFATVAGKADKAGMSLAAFARTATVGAAGPRSLPPVPADAYALRQVLGHLGKVGSNLNQIARLGAVGRLTWNARDAALVRKLGARVDDLVEEVVHLLSALRAKQGLRDQASSFVPAADASAEAPK